MMKLIKRLFQKNNKEASTIKPDTIPEVNNYSEIGNKLPKEIQLYKSDVLGTMVMFNIIAPDTIIKNRTVLDNLLNISRYCHKSVQRILEMDIKEIGELNRYIITMFSLLHQITIKIPKDKELVSTYSFIYCYIDTNVWSNCIEIINSSLFPMYTKQQIIDDMNVHFNTDVKTIDRKIKSLLEIKLYRRFICGLGCDEGNANHFNIMYSQMADLLLVGQLEYETNTVSKNNPYKMTKDISYAIINTIEEMYKHEEIISSECKEKRI